MSAAGRCKIGCAKANEIKATISKRNKSNQRGVLAGVSSSVFMSANKRRGGKFKTLGVGGAILRMSQTKGRAIKPNKARGARNVKLPILTPHTRLA